LILTLDFSNFVLCFYNFSLPFLFRVNLLLKVLVSLGSTKLFQIVEKANSNWHFV